MKITERQKDELWGEDGPYSQANLIIQARILDDRVSRVFLVVEVDINPLTYRVVKKHRDEFNDDLMIQQLLDHSKYRGQEFGYVSCSFEAEYTDNEVMEEAKKHLEHSKNTIIKMHKFIIDWLSNNQNKHNND